MYDRLHFNLLEPARNITLVENYAGGVDKQSDIWITTMLKKANKQHYQLLFSYFNMRNSFKHSITIESVTPQDYHVRNTW